ncbi:MAG: hypothetical protein J7L86_05420 [Candidatus Marinimicrobia bacterium]|nr:hypothetical protein [Candidatus Neomarinimicrobiota bacterium]
MNLLAQILSSKVRSEIFRLLLGTKTRELHLREIERKTGFGIGTVQQSGFKRSDYMGLKMSTSI